MIKKLSILILLAASIISGSLYAEANRINGVPVVLSNLSCKFDVTDRSSSAKFSARIGSDELDGITISIPQATCAQMMLQISGNSCTSQFTADLDIGVNPEPKVLGTKLSYYLLGYQNLKAKAGLCD